MRPISKVFVIGAGASRDAADLPLGQDLVWRYHSQTGLFKIVGEHGQIDLSGENASYANLTRFLEWAVEVYPELKPDLEAWRNRGLYHFERRFENKQYYVDEMLKVAFERDQLDTLELIRRLIFEHLVEATRRGKSDLYYDFLELLLRDADPGEVIIITFNFDYLLVEDFKREIYFDYGLDFDYQHGREAYCRRHPIRLLKLNGSLDWGLCSACGKLHLYYPNLFRGHYEDNVCAVDCGGKLSPYILVPHQSYDGPILSLWDEAACVIREAEHISVIGYSFPDYDDRARDLLSSNLRPNTKVTVVDYRPDDNPDLGTSAIQKHYATLLPSLDSLVDVHLDGFAAYVEHLKNG